MRADNKLTENSEWDKRILAEQLMTLSLADLDFSVAVTGFEVGEIDVMIENLAPVGGSKNDPSDVLPDLGTKPHVSRVGDLWILDRHRVYCGDARSENSYAALIKDCRAHMAFTDPRYNNPADGHLTGPPGDHQPQFTITSGEITQSEVFTFLTAVLAEMVRNTLEGAVHFICMDWRRSEELISAARSVYSEFKDLCVWVKDGGKPGSLYKSRHELIFVFKKGKKSHHENIQLGKRRRCRTNVWHYPSVNSTSSDPASSAILCRTIKPVELVADAILDCTARGNVVLDPFVGTGTTIIAAERTGRVCFGMEREPALVDMAVRRWQCFTGHAAVHDVTRETFAQREREAADGRK
jgi:DNA modification methylase